MKLLTRLFLVSMVIMGLAISMSSAAESVGGGQRKNTCEKNPMVCEKEGSGGRDCCNKKCVDISRDIANCGKCGKKCSFGKICCEGKCVNPRSNKKHCGKCGNKCSVKGSSCVYGLCNYAS